MLKEVKMNKKEWIGNLWHLNKLETQVKCDNCGLEFAIYGVFASCPDCGQLNALRVFEKSIEVALKRITLIDTIEEDDDEDCDDDD